MRYHSKAWVGGRNRSLGPNRFFPNLVLETENGRLRSADRAYRRRGAGAGVTGDGRQWRNIVRPSDSPHFQVRPRPHQRVRAAFVCSWRQHFQAESPKLRGSPQARPCSHAPDSWLHRQPFPLPCLLPHAHKFAEPCTNTPTKLPAEFANGYSGCRRRSQPPQCSHSASR